jgi:hypothetical protein
MSVEQDFTEQLVEQYKNEGWMVEDAGDAAKQLEFRPDLIFKRGDEVLVVEVKHTGFVSDRALSMKRRRVEERPNWRFELKLIPPGYEVKMQRPLREDVKRRVRVARRLFDEGFASESFVLCWTALEAILRDLAGPNEDVRPETPAQIVRRAYEAEVITDAELLLIQRSYQIRSRLIHGFAVEAADQEIRELLPVVEALVKRAEGADKS